jgi:dephospho-CoA kinase
MLNRMLLIGLTGGIASGKTLVADRFAELGVPVIDADVLAREVVQPGTDGLAALVEQFSNNILTIDKQLDRPALRALIFSEPEHRKTVESILHPLIRQLGERRIAEADASQHAYIIYAIPLLVETGQTDRFDRILVVDVPVPRQLERLMNRDGNTRLEAESILNAQASRNDRLAIADDVISNDGSVTDTYHQVDDLHLHYVSLAVA